MTQPPQLPLIIFDSECLTCNWIVHFIIQRDSGLFTFSTGKEEEVKMLLKDSQYDISKSIYVIDESLSVYSQSDAVIEILGRLSGLYPLLGKVIKFAPKRLRDLGYDIFSRNRYRFQREDKCPILSPEMQRRIYSKDKA